LHGAPHHEVIAVVVARQCLAVEHLLADVLLERTAQLIRGWLALPGAHERGPLLQQIGAGHYNPP
jgi:hypothetical protein